MKQGKRENHTYNKRSAKAGREDGTRFGETVVKMTSRGFPE